ncbi:type IV secretion system protein VirB10 [Pseudomonas syringae pv. coryli]|uniref:type IV secretion system protein VirB10 n=1 Tax=Pseudomonas syringae pv. coryli TaxID=317659 RepID=UPI003D2D5DC1
MENNPYDQFNPDEESEPLANPEPLAADRGEPTTRGPKPKRRGKVLAVVIVVFFSLVAVGLFGVFFYNAMAKKKDSAADAVAADPALEQKSSTGPDLGAYQDRVRKQLDEDRKKLQLEEQRRLAAAKAEQDQNANQGLQGSTAAAPDLGKYQGQGQGQPGNAGSNGSGKKGKEQLTPQQQAAARRLEGDVMWDEKNATGGVGQHKASQTNQGMDRYYSQATRNANSQAKGGENPSFEERMAANPYLGGANGGGDSGSGGGLGGKSGGEGGGIGGMLATEDMPEGRAYVRPDLKYLLMHGTTTSCVLLPRIVTNYPGQTRCMINRDVYSADGSVVLMRSGSVANGERKVTLKQGVAKVFVAWRDVETPEGVSIRLDSMAADSLGAAGLDAWVDNHYPERFGGAILLSLLDDTFKALADQAGNKQGGVTFDSSTDNAQDMSSIALENSINIPPTGYVNQGTELTILVARDVDFRSIYGVE